MRTAIFGLVGSALIAIGFAVFYAGLLPESFDGPLGVNGPLGVTEAIYFSFVTIATIGYGIFNRIAGRLPHSFGDLRNAGRCILLSSFIGNHCWLG